MGNESDAERFFDAIAPRYDRVYGLESSVSRARMGAVVAELGPSSRVLDLGVGTGRALPALLDAGHRPVGFDVSPAMLALCAKRLRPVTLVRGNFWEPLPFGDASFDAVIALFGALAHAPDDDALERLPRELARVLAAGGVFIAELPTPAWLDLAEQHGGIEGVFSLVRTAGDRCRHEDAVARVGIDARFVSEARWCELLVEHFDVRVDPLDAFEFRIVARRR